MNELFSASLEIKTPSIDIIISNYSKGIFAIPEFQRDFVWKPKKAPVLLDSLYRGYPIGSLLTWSTDKKVHSRVKGRIATPTQWIIDGQQRTRTLVGVMNGDIPVLFDVEKESFLLENAATKKAKNSLVIPVVEIWGNQYLSLGGEIAPKYHERLERCKKILDVRIPEIHLGGHSLDEAIIAFQRINTQGMRLKATDIEVAELTVRHSGFVKNSVQPFLDQLKSRGWDRVYLSHLFMACQGIAEQGRTAGGRNRLHDLTTKDLELAWSKLTKGVNEAIQFLGDELGIHNGGIFPSGAMLMPLAVLKARSIKNRIKYDELVTWLVNVSLTKRYSTSAAERLDADIQSCFTANPMKALQSNIRKSSARSNISATPQNFMGALHDRYGIFLTYLACRFVGMKDLFDGRQVSASTAQRHHIIPRASVSKNMRRELDVISNIAFITANTNQDISNKRSIEYLAKIPSNFLSSQCIPIDQSCWDDPNLLMKARAKLLAKQINMRIKR